MLVMSMLVVPKENVVVGKNEVPVSVVCSVADDEEDNDAIVMAAERPDGGPSVDMDRAWTAQSPKT